MNRLTLEDDFGDFESRGESLLSLVQPELANLSTHWLSALKDYALLSLPAEYASQLPHDGGAFYTNDTMNLSKPHYLTSWPPILYASALWLNSEGFSKTESDETSDDNDDKVNATDLANGNKIATDRMHPNESTISGTASATISYGSVSADRFHLVFGICMEALCSTRTNEKLESVIACLQALYTMFDSKWSRQMLTKNKSLPVELCNVLHRLILTRDSLEVQYLCISILKQTIVAANECLDLEKQDKMAEFENKTDNGNDENRDIDNLGEGGEEGEILPGKSHVYAILEVVLCLLARQIPAMSPSQSARVANEQLQRQIAQTKNGLFKLSEDNSLLVATAINSMTDLTRLCSPTGAVSILPTMLYLTTGVIKEVATKSVNDETIIANSNIIQAALQLLFTSAPSIKRMGDIVAVRPNILPPENECFPLLVGTRLGATIACSWQSEMVHARRW